MEYSWNYEYFGSLAKLMGFTFTLQETQSINDSINIPKIEFIAYFYAPKGTLGAYSNRTVHPSVPPASWSCISLIYFEVGIPNLVCGCILGWRGVSYHFRVTVTLTSDLVFIVIKCPSVRPSVRPASCPVHISYTLWGRNSKFDVWMHLGMAECRVPFLGHCDLDLDLWPSF